MLFFVISISILIDIVIPAALICLLSVVLLVLDAPEGTATECLHGGARACDGHGNSETLGDRNSKTLGDRTTDSIWDRLCRTLHG